MKLVLAIVDDDDAGALMDALIEHEFTATKLASTGGFLRRGNTTLLMGIDDDRVDTAIEVIRSVCVRRKKLLPQTPAEIPTSIAMPIEVESGGATVFVLDVQAFHKI